MCARRPGNIFLFLFFFYCFFFVVVVVFVVVVIDNFTGSKDTEPYKTDFSFLCQYIILSAFDGIFFIRAPNGKGDHLSLASKIAIFIRMKLQ